MFNEYLDIRLTAGTGLPANAASIVNRFAGKPAPAVGSILMFGWPFMTATR
jgi:hypothetical protein